MDFRVYFNSIHDAKKFQSEVYKHYRNSYFKRFARRNGSIVITNATRKQIYWILNDSRLNGLITNY